MSIESNYLKWLADQRQHYPNLLKPFESGNATHALLGIGDDAAVIPTSPKTVVCTDLIAEGTHFVVDDDRSLQLAGRKALAVNISDIAAMGAVPTDAVLSILVSRESGFRQATQITKGLLDLASEFRVRLIGGDTCTSAGPVVINVTLLGQLEGQHPLLRSGAQPGDVIVVTGSFGGSILGKHLNFQPRLNEIRSLRERVTINSLTDVTDGLARDLYSILESSQVGATIDADAIPIADAVHLLDVNAISPSPIAPPYQDFAAAHSLAPGLYHALNDGEDFELLLTMAESQWHQLHNDLRSGKIKLSCPMTPIGRIESGDQLKLRANDQTLVLPPGGYDH